MSTDPIDPSFVLEGHVIEAKKLKSGLHLVATPLGNLGDISNRALGTLAGVDTILCEDTRVTGKLLKRFSIATRMRPYHDHNAGRVRPEILQKLLQGASFALVSDAGMPAISDPGFKLVRACLDEGIEVDVIPGPTAPVMALVLSGLPTDKFMFAGFLSSKTSQRRAQLQELANAPASLVFFESAKRLAASLNDIAETLPGRQVAVARELTKLHQEVLRGSPQELVADLDVRGGVKGEITLVVEPPSSDRQILPEDLEARLGELLTQYPAGKAAGILARETGQPRAGLYELAVKLKEGG